VGFKVIELTLEQLYGGERWDLKVLYISFIWKMGKNAVGRHGYLTSDWQSGVGKLSTFCRMG